MTPSQPKTRGRVAATRRTVEGHDEILRALADLESHLEVTPAPVRRYRKGLAARLDRLSNLLAAHYAWEETSRLYVDVPDRHPEFAPNVAQLRREHDTTIAALDWMKVAVQEIDDADAMGRFIPMIEILATLLRRHEEEEERIVHAVIEAEAGRRM
jgi:hemerythrin-like domain-containing protein